jgi:hypothetical protein
LGTAVPRSRRSRLAVPCSGTDLRRHAASDLGVRRGRGHDVLGRARCVTAERNGPNVRADERIPFGALVETDLLPAKHCARVIANGFAPLALTVFSRRMSRCCIVVASDKNRPIDADSC